MSEAKYFEPRHLLYDWQNQQIDLNDQQADEIRQAEADIEAYVGYPEIQMDVARTAVASLVKSDHAETSPNNVVAMKKPVNMPRTVNVVVKTNLATGKQIL